MSGKPLTLDAVKEQFCIADKMAALGEIKEQLENTWDIEKAADLLIKIGERMEKEVKAAGVTWDRLERMLWVVKEAFILGHLDMATNMMMANEMGYEALAGQQKEPPNQGGDERAQLIMSIVRMLNMADEKKIKCIYQFVLNLV